MRSHRFSHEQQEAVSRRLALLSAELTAVREEQGDTAVRVPAGQSWQHPPDTHTRLAPHRRSALGEPVVPPAPDDSLVPVPGRHALGRAGLGTRWLPPVGRGALGPAQLVAVVLLVVVGLGATSWWLLRSTPVEVAEPPTVTPLVGGAAGSPVVPDDDAPVDATSAAAPSEVVVDVAGKVRRPGIAVLEPGSRVVDALKAAGGARAGVDLSGINLARVLVDGEQILVGVAPPVGIAAGAAATPPASGAAPAALVPLNTADQPLLESLPDVGPVTAQAIISWRDEHGGFSSVDELLEVDGIGETTLGRLAPLVTL